MLEGLFGKKKTPAGAYMQRAKAYAWHVSCRHSFAFLRTVLHHNIATLALRAIALRQWRLARIRSSHRVHAELLRENKRLIDKSIREIDRERNSLQMQENKLIMEMKKNAKNGQMVCCPLDSQAGQLRGASRGTVPHNAMVPWCGRG
jgi:hypothetical protein